MQRPTKVPMNVSLLHPDIEIQKHGYLPVSSHMIHDPGTNTFHPDGLFSEIIFDQIGSANRMIRFAYIDLKTRIFQPIVFRNLISLKSFYNEILSGKCYVYFDKKEKDFIRCKSDDEGAGTGYSFFLKYYNQIQFTLTNSLARTDKIKILDAYKDRVFIDRYLVLPAGIRDIKEENGMLASEDINKLYLAALSMANGLPDTDEELNPVYDTLRYNIQLKIVEIYEYILNIVDGKKGYGRGKLGARNIALGTRNVITSAPMTEVESPYDPKFFKNDEALIPLYQAAKAATPLVSHALRTIFFSTIFTEGARNIALISPTDLKIQYHEIDEDQRSLFTTSDGVEKLINLLQNEHIRHKPVSVLGKDKKPLWMYLMYDLGDTLYCFRNLPEFISHLTNEDKWSIAPLLPKLEKLIPLGVNKEEVIVVGSGALVAYGYPYGFEDLDVKVSPRVYERLLASGKFTKTDRSLVYEDIEVYTDHPEFGTYEGILSSAVSIEGYKVVPIQHMYDNYVKVNRSKDKKKLQWCKEHIFISDKVRALTYGEMMYIAAYHSLHDKYCTFTRYPVLNELGILTPKIHIQTTEPNRTVTLRLATNDTAVVLPRYPILHGAIYQDSMCPHPSSLAGYDGDFDKLRRCRSKIAELSKEVLLQG